MRRTLQAIKEAINNRSIISRWIGILCCLTVCPPLFAEEPRIAIIMDDMGYSRERGLEALGLKEEITYSFLPHAPYTPQLQEIAWQQGKEVMVHLPMQSMSAEELDPGGLRMDMARKQFYETLLKDLDAVPHAIGVNNHMGSLLTRHPGVMKWLMVGLKSYGGLFFIDSRTSEESVAAKIALEKGIPAASRDVFLDHERSETSIEHQMDLLVIAAKANGSAIGISHPYPETLAVLSRRLPVLKRAGINLVKTSALVTTQNKRADQWRASLFPLPRVVKNLRPSQ